MATSPQSTVLCANVLPVDIKTSSSVRFFQGFATGAHPGSIPPKIRNRHRTANQRARAHGHERTRHVAPALRRRPWPPPWWPRPAGGRRACATRHADKRAFTRTKVGLQMYIRGRARSGDGARGGPLGAAHARSARPPAPRMPPTLRKPAQLAGLARGACSDTCEHAERPHSEA